MQLTQKSMPPGGMLMFCMFVLNAIIMEKGLVTNSGWYFFLLFTIPLLVASIFNFKERQSHSNL